MIGIIPLVSSRPKSQNNSVLPITPSRFDSILSKWAHIAHFGESGSVYYYTKANLLWRIHQLQIIPDALTKYFSQKKVGYIDVDMSILEDENDWKYIIEESKKFDVLFILGLDRYLIEKNRKVFTVLEYWHAQQPNISFIYFFQRDFLHPDFITLFSAKSVFFQNIIFEPFHPRRDCVQFIHHMAREWNLTVKSAQTKIILEVCGQHFWFIKESLRRLRDEKEISKKSLLHNPILLSKAQYVWNSLNSSEQNVLIKIITKKPLTDLKEIHSLEFLQQTGWIIRQREIYKPTILLLEEYVRSKVLKFTLEYINKTIQLNKVPIDTVFSDKERIILQLLLQKKNLVNRDEIASAIWKEKTESLYSDWAIDKLISRLRKKLQSLGLENTIKTVRRSGFILNT